LESFTDRLADSGRAISPVGPIPDPVVPARLHMRIEIDKLLSGKSRKVFSVAKGVDMLGHFADLLTAEYHVYPVFVAAVSRIT
jgi:hypothetical protein